LGVDPGLTRCGLGVVDSFPGRRVALVASGVARTPAGDPLDRRLLAISIEIAAWLDRYQPDAVAVERVFAQHNVMTITGTAQVAGLAMVEAARRDLEVAMHTPTEVKAAVTGDGGAGKEQVGHMVARLLEVASIPGPADVADALALAICHAWRPTTLSPSGTAATPAQKAWVEAERAARRKVKA
jgi:crossover junction endodeoxyribonuclease RuvC